MTARTDSQKVILRFLDGKLLKGFVKDFTLADDFVFIEDESSDTQKVRLKEIKAIFFVKKFEGDKNHREKKSFAGTKSAGRRIFLRFKDGESLTGCVEGETPWKTGFFLESMKENGFFLIPVDEESNNIKIFVVTSAIRDVTMIGG
jgi:hypothetical protein